MQMFLDRAKRNTAPKHGGSLHAPGLHEHLTAGQEADSNSHRTSLSTQTAKQITRLRLNCKEGKGHFTNGVTENNDLRAQSACHLPELSPVTEDSARVMLQLTILRVCVQTHSRASLSQKEQMAFVPNGNGFSAQT